MTKMITAKGVVCLLHLMTIAVVLICLSMIAFSWPGYELGHLKPKYFQPKADYSQIGQNINGLNPKIRLLCWVLANPRTQDRKALAVKTTWGKRCDKLIFMSTKSNSNLGAISLNITEGKNKLWSKTRVALKYLYDHHINEYDWFFKADDDTFVIVENLRYVLTPYDSEFPIGLGGRFLNHQTEYLGGGSGYVLSRAALKRLMEGAYDNPKLCKPTTHNSFAEDVLLGQCLTNSGVMLGDSRDEFGKRRFFQYTLEDYIIGKHVYMYPKDIKYKVGKGIDSISETTVIIHPLKDETKLYAYEFLIYKLKLFGASYHEFNGPFPAPLPPDVSSIPEQVLKKYGHPDLKKRNTSTEK